MRYIVVLGVLTALAAPYAVAAYAQEESAAASQTPISAESCWQVGYAQADITPRPGQAMLAGFGQERYVEGTLSPLRAQVLVFQDKTGRRAMLGAIDVINFGPDTIEVLRHKLQAAYGLNPADICLAASHTHWGPAINFRMCFALGAPDVWYISFLEDTILRLAGEAIRDLAPAKVEYGDCDVQIGINRRMTNQDGRVVWGPNPDGSYDRHTPILRILREKSPKQLILVGHGCHPSGVGKKIAKWSSGYPGAMRDRLESEIDDSRAIFVMGCGGEIKVSAQNPETGRLEFADHPDQSRAAGENLADEVLKRIQGKFIPLRATLKTALERGSLSLAEPLTRKQIVEMALKKNRHEYETWWARQMLAFPDNRTALDYEVQTWRLGPLTLVALEGEPCSEWGERIRGMVSSGPAMVVGYVNFCPGYIPTAQIIREGGYEGDESHKAYFLPARFDLKVESELTALLRRALNSGDKPL